MLPDFSSPEFLYCLHSAQFDLPALQGLWLTLGHKPQAEKRTESEAYLEVTLCLLYQGWMGQDTSNPFDSQILTTHWSKVPGNAIVQILFIMFGHSKISLSVYLSVCLRGGQQQHWFCQ